MAGTPARRTHGRRREASPLCLSLGVRQSPFLELLFGYEPGDTVTFQILRGDEELDLEIELAAREE